MMGAARGDLWESRRRRRRRRQCASAAAAKINEKSLSVANVPDGLMNVYEGERER
jgi:hypothetical protein